MHIILNAPGIHHVTKEALEGELRESLPRMRQLLFRFRPEEKNLRVHLAQEKSENYRLTISLRMPGRSLIVERTGNNLMTLVNEAKQAMLEQIKVQASVVRKEHLRAKGVQQREAIREAVGAPSLLSSGAADAEEIRERFVSRLRLVLQELYSHVRRLIRLAQLAGDLPSGTLRPGEVVDDVIGRAYGVYTDNPNEEISPAKMYQLAQEILRDEIRNHRGSADWSAAGEALDEQDPRWTVSDVGDEVLGFYQRETGLLYADLMPDLEIPAELEALDEEEQMRRIFERLHTASPEARSAFFLSRMEGFANSEIAWMQDRTGDEVAKL